MISPFRLFERQAIEISCLEAEALALAIHEFVVHTPQERRLSLQEALCLSYLVRASRRLTVRVGAEHLKPRPQPFNFKFHWTELLAINSCLKETPTSPLLRTILGKVHQKAINLNLA